eukprot:14360621-Ditylum_brightwellii.AAC.1
MGKREYGNTSSLQKVKLLLARWFGVKKDPTKNKPEGLSVIECGSVVQIQNNDRIFVVFEVWKTMASENAKSDK